MRHSKLTICTGVSGLVVFVVGVALGWFGFPAIILHEVRNGLVLANGSEAFERWRKLPLSIDFKVYMWNVTNPDEVVQGANPILEEIGPYHYDQYREKYDIGYEDNDTLSYYEKSTFYFNQEKSGKNLSQDDVVTILNLALLGTILKVQKVMPMAIGMMDPILPEIFVNYGSIFMTVPVRDVLWEGVTIIDCNHNISDMGKTVCKMLPPNLPLTVKMTSEGVYDFAFFAYKNNTNNGRFRVKRGLEEIKDLGRIVEWNEEDSLSIWSGESSTCNMINGSDSTIFKPFMSPEDSVDIFVSDVCRSLRGEYKYDVKVEGIPAMHFVASKTLLASGKNYPPNLCFCEGTADDDPEDRACLKDGALDLYPCLGVPVIMTFPHFFNGSPDYMAYVEGVHPDKSKHETFTDLEPKTGVLIRGKKRMQMNMFLTKVEEITILHNVSEGLFPALWLEEGVTLGEPFLSKFRKLNFLLSVFDILKWLVPLGGLMLSFYTLCKYVSDKNKSENEIFDANKVIVSYDNRGYSNKPEELNGR